jgi:hypothetical protein
MGEKLDNQGKGQKIRITVAEMKLMIQTAKHTCTGYKRKRDILKEHV